MQKKPEIGTAVCVSPQLSCVTDLCATTMCVPTQNTHE